ncbi:MAG TPA: hypothetical protein VLS45_06140, partial [Methylomicrobium sp.]|nr:hypothetical protein [Methylomicrobium sp.]
DNEQETTLQPASSATMTSSPPAELMHQLADQKDKLRQQEEHIQHQHAYITQQNQLIEDYKQRAKEAEAKLHSQQEAHHSTTQPQTKCEPSTSPEQSATATSTTTAPAETTTPEAATATAKATKKATKKGVRPLLSEDASDTDKLRDAVQQITKLAITDSNLTPKPFNGKRLDPMVHCIWIDYFLRYTNFKQMDDEGKLDLFKLLMTDQAADWLKSLPSTTTDDFDVLLEAFKQRFAHTKLQTWRTATSIWKTTQKPTESVDEFITTIKNTARKIPGMDDQQIIYAILQGLRPSIRAHVLQQSHDTLQQVESAARIAEEALRELNSDNTVVADLAKAVNTLVDQFSQQSSSIAGHHYAEPNVYASSEPVFQQHNQQLPRSRPTSPRPSTSWAPTRQQFNNNGARSDYRPSKDTVNRRQFNAPPNPGQWQQSPPPPSRRQPQRQWSSGQNSYRRPQQQQQQQPLQPTWPASYNGRPMGSPRFGRPPPRSQSPGPQSSGSTIQECTNCLRSHAQGQCFAFGSTCYFCNKRGHVSRACCARLAQNCSNQQ